MPSIIRRLMPAGLKRRLKLAALAGDTVQCPLCGKGAIAYLPSGDPPRPHALCAFCGSMERTRMIWLHLRQRGLPKPGAQILHIAPERGIRERLRAMPGVHYMAGDKHEPGYTYPPDTMDLDVTALPFPDDHFDLVLCSHVLEHVPDDRKAMRELHRVLKPSTANSPGGTGIILVPIEGGRATTYEDPSITGPTERKRAFGQFDHVRIYGSDYTERLRDAGFSVEELDPSRSMDPVAFFRAGLKLGELLYVVGRG